MLSQPGQLRLTQPPGDDDCLLLHQGRRRSATTCCSRASLPGERAIARDSLLVLDGVRNLRTNVLDQCSAARDVQYLHAEADGEQRYSSSFRGVDHQQISSSLMRMDRPERRVRLLAISQRIDVGIAARQKYPIESFDYGFDVVGVRNQADVHGRAAAASTASL